MINLNKPMPKINIYGLPPGDKVRTKVSIFDRVTFNTSGAIRLFVGYPDNNGTITCNIPKKYFSKKIVLMVNTSEYFSYIKHILEVSPLGVFHTVKLEREILYDNTKVLPIDIETWYVESLGLMKKDYRNSKYRNSASKTLNFTITFGSPIVGFFVAGYIGILIGILLALGTVFLGKYASGKSKGV